MAELTKDQIKEALGFIADGKRLLDVFEKAESAIAVLGQLNATVDSLGAKAEKLRAEVVALDGKKLKFASEQEAHKESLDTQRALALTSIEAEANSRRMQIAQEFSQIGLDHAEKIAEMENDRKMLAQVILDLSGNRDAIVSEIALLEESQSAEQARLDAILSQIAELKSRL